MDYQKIIDRYYPEDNKLKYILITHSRLVSQRALKICDAHPELGMDRQFIEEAAMLHDIGICRCDAPGIECFGTEPYICHCHIRTSCPRHSKKNSSAMLTNFTARPIPNGRKATTALSKV